MKNAAPKFKFFVLAGVLTLILLGILRLLGDCISFGILGHWVNFKAFDPVQEIGLPLLSLFFGFLIGGVGAGIIEAIYNQKIDLGSRKSYLLITLGSVFSYLILKSWFF